MHTQATPPPGHVDRTWHAASVKSASVKSSAGDPVAFNFFSGLKPHMLMKRKASKKGASPTRQRTKPVHGLCGERFPFASSGCKLHLNNDDVCFCKHARGPYGDHFPLA
eukprot:1138386-Pelagomonas_calceolata.AAC.3